MKLKQVLTLSLIAILLTLSACGTPKPNTPGSGGFNAKGISSGVLTSLTAVQSTLQSLVNAGKTQFRDELAAINQVLGIAGTINADIQNGAFNGTTEQKINSLASLASSLAITFGAGSNLVLAINIGVGLFNSIRNAFTGNGAPAGAGSAPVDYKAQQKELDQHVKDYKAELAARGK
jgi:hypothetical protein